MQGKKQGLFLCCVRCVGWKLAFILGLISAFGVHLLINAVSCCDVQGHCLVMDSILGQFTVKWLLPAWVTNCLCIHHLSAGKLNAGLLGWVLGAFTYVLWQVKLCDPI